MKIRRLLIGMAAIAMAAGAFALPPGDPPPDPPKLNDCSPGFWKNHQEYWASQYCGSSQGCINDVMENLTAKGKGSGDIRQTQADNLNEWADDPDLGYGYRICVD